MTDTIQIRITDDIIATLGEITTANGYEQTLLVEEPTPGAGNRTRTYETIVLIGMSEELDSPHQKQRWRTEYQIITAIVHSETDTSTSLSERISRVRADIWSRLCSNDGNAYQRNGLAIDTVPLDVRTEDTVYVQGKNQVDIVTRVAVTWQHAYANPFAE